MKTYIIGEIGQNHNGSVELAKVIIDLASRDIKDEVFGGTLNGMDAVKLTKRDLNQELSASQMSRVYDNHNSFGRTYGEHRSALELTDQEHFEVFKYAKEKGHALVGIELADPSDLNTLMESMIKHRFLKTNLNDDPPLFELLF